jgi:hypothetical protein
MVRQATATWCHYEQVSRSQCCGWRVTSDRGPAEPCVVWRARRNTARCSPKTDIGDPQMEAPVGVGGHTVERGSPKRWVRFARRVHDGPQGQQHKVVAKSHAKPNAPSGAIDDDGQDAHSTQTRSLSWTWLCGTSCRSQWWCLRTPTSYSVEGFAGPVAAAALSVWSPSASLLLAHNPIVLRPTAVRLSFSFPLVTNPGQASSGSGSLQGSFWVISML